MGAIKMSGIVSGMDTNAIVEQLVAQSQIPITNLENKYELKQLEKDIYQDVSDRLGTLNSNLLTLRLESTYKTKSTESSNTAVLAATATTEAAKGSYSVVVKQTAKNASWVSSYTRQRLTAKGAGVTGSTGTPADYLEGKHTVTVTNEGSSYMAVNSFKPNEWGTVKKQNGMAIDSAVVSSDGTIQSDISGTVTFQVSDGTDTSSIWSSVNVDSGDNINEVARDLETRLNNNINSDKGTTGVQYVAVRADYNQEDDEWSIAVYSPTTVTGLTITPTGGDIDETLGLEYGYESTSSVSTVTSYFIASDLTTLGQKINNTESGLIKGITLTGTGLTEGSFSITQDASLLVASESYSTVTGATGFSATPSTALTQNLSDAGGTTASNGYFTINDTKIYIDDFSALTVNDLLAKINSSGAGVTATYDEAANNIVLSSNTAGSGSITVGDSSDTSNMLTVLKLTANQGAVKTTGSTSGSISTTSALSSAGLSSAPTSGTFSINGVSIYVDATTDSLNDVIKKVNVSGAGVTMVYDSVRDKITVTGSGTEQITFGSPSDTSSFLAAVNLTQSTTTTQALGTAGRNSIVEVNEVTYVRDSNEISDIIAGVTLDLRSASETPVTISITADTTKATEALASFIQTYNEMVTVLNAPMLDDDQKKYLTALTDEDKESMSDDDIAEYQAYYKEYNTYNMIRKSSELRSLKQNLRTTLFTEIPGLTGSISNLLELGIDVAGDGDITIEALGLLVTDSTDYDEILAALESNETLQEVLSDNADDVYEFFSANIIVGNDDSDTEDEDGNPINESNDIQGWTRIYSSLITRYTNYDGMIQKKIVSEGTLDKEMLRIAEQIETYQLRAEQQLERYWAQFTAMEQAISDAQAMGESLSSLTSSS
ncbi:flagellar hook protein [Geovibrio thiophilus]|uniref:Flagellar hook-associated protein 2 n=1 Tax=Geovibrio thiophilus TaxID=139438 RepID=A0A3R5X2X2_9BACT|nr:flagellar filament capping protein FliD [Geovibrio thiophilus]QAR33249.1 flagellar hook protein [Geovibrio thiophilus]